ncbi:phospholipase A1-like [Plodia interpunctella]|uniref:phospholipase A1-like n=1 Tax=Plodia interpunctella TaxID=58824 RepID=UPI0023688415|nr:phospholipase A1-like [Plodia interpunctella]
MHHYLVIVTIVLLIYKLSVALTMAPPTARRRLDVDLNFAETVYVKVSDACRAIMDLRYNTKNDQSNLLKTMKIIRLHNDTTQTYPIDTAYQALTQAGVFDITKQTKVVIHGFRDNSQSDVPYDLAQAYNEKKMFNVLLVDAEELVSKGYILSAYNVRLVGKRLANLLANLENFGASADDFHLLGISLGAHIAGSAGKYYRQYKSRSLGRITGLDPAGPCFTFADASQRLDKTDAGYVDVIHSNKMIQGILESVGHADFYLNGGGPTQPGCFMPSCSHLRAAKVYIESIRVPQSFIGVKCDSYKGFKSNICDINNLAVLGYGSSTSCRGDYHLRTSSKAPYGLGMAGITYDSKGKKTMPTDSNDWFRMLK